MRRKSLCYTLLVLFLAAVLLFSAGCGAGEPQAFTQELFSMDTVMRLSAYGPEDEAALQAAAAELERLDGALSATRPDSPLYILNAAGGGALSPDLQALLPQALDISQMTGGAFDPTLLPLSQLWGFYGDGTPAVPAQADIDRAMASCGYEKLTLSDDTLTFQAPGMGLDLGGIGKGYAAGRLLALLKDAGVESAILSLGGNVQTLGMKPDGSPWQVAIQDPFDGNAYAGILSCGETAVVTSGTYQRYFEENGRRYHHILNRESGWPAESGLASVTIVCTDAVLADGLSTALLVMGPEMAAAFWQAHSDLFQAVLIGDDGTLAVTAGLADSFSAPGGFEVINR